MKGSGNDGVPRKGHFSPSDRSISAAAERTKLCPRCGGTGRRGFGLCSPDVPPRCLKCGGSGVVSDADDTDVKVCSRCGKVIDEANMSIHIAGYCKVKAAERTLEVEE